MFSIMGDEKFMSVISSFGNTPRTKPLTSADISLYHLMIIRSTYRWKKKSLNGEFANTRGVHP